MSIAQRRMNNIKQEGDVQNQEEQPLFFSVKHTVNIPDDLKKPTLLYLHEVPQWFEDRFRKFDDTIIRSFQSGVFSLKFFKYFSLMLTLLTTIELGTTTPLVLYVLGYDTQAYHALFLGFTVAFLSQIPKRFLWRYRPYVVQRARKVRKDKTSSFPSRAVTCAVVYAFFICQAASGQYVSAATIPSIMFAAVCSSFARINLGVHYPSDCLFGFLQGIVSCILGSLLALSFPEPLYYSSSTGDARHRITSWSGDYVNWKIIFVTLIIAEVVAVLSVLRPLRFWVKSHHVFGMLFPSACFHLAFVNPKWSPHEGALQSPVLAPPAAAFAVAGALAVYCTLVGYVVKGKGVLTCVFAITLLFGSVFVCVGSWRIHSQ
eukprot:ANDGO_07532.mRNA.1 PAP2 superfamily domain containing protein